ncbi:MAG: hypothetical protein B6U72_02785 [Candidatus Altiarchaeales archaeon ex4484_2]|nr:MAG: hypothetical protein B6U72_02785 [Candidatus Altiarchaeales archaeon ex4484_2]
MLDEEHVERFAPFKGSAYTAFFISNLVVFLIVLFVCVSALVFITAITVPALVLAPSKLLDPVLLFLGLVFILALTGIIAASWYTREFFKTFIYEPRKDYFFSRKGVVTPSYTLIPYKNIQDIHMEQSIYDRIFGLWSMKIYSATFSTRGSDIIFGLSKKTAERLKTELLERMRGVKQVVD